MLKYILVENSMVAKPNKCVAVVSSPEVKSLNDVIDSMISEGSGLTRPQALAYFERLTQIIEQFVEQGHRVVTPLVRFHPHISGGFTDLEDSFDAARHQINIRAIAGTRLQKSPEKIKLEKINVSSQVPVPLLFIDGNSKKMNFAVPEGIGILKGKRMKFDTSDHSSGIFFIPEEKPAIEIRADVYYDIKPSEIYFKTPLLLPGSYKIIVKTMNRKGNLIQTGQLKEIITVLA